MSRNASYYIKTVFLVLFGLIIVAYSVYQARNILFAPTITLVSPIDGETYTDPLIHVKGVATHAAYLTLDDRALFADKKGNFDDTLLLGEGYTIIKISAEDKFGKKTEKIIQVLLKKQ